MLEAILCPDWQYRCYSFNARWALDQAMASFRNGLGDDYFLLFLPAGAILKGFAHEASMSPYAFDPPHVWSGVLDIVPAVFTDFLNEPAFMLEQTTFCLWRTIHDATWQRGPVQYPDTPDPDGSVELLAMLDGNPLTYHAYAEAYYKQPVQLAVIQHLYAQQPLTQAVIRALNPDLTLADIQADLDEIRYPS
jgi:hypothetical protein